MATTAKQKKQNQAILIGAGVLVAAGVAYYFITKDKNKEAEVVQDTTPAANNTTTTPKPAAPKPATPTVTLNKSLVLKIGSKGNEVKELQKLLGVAADGIFGAQTEAALVAMKNVKQVTLNQFATLATINRNALPIGTKVFANVHPSTPYYKAIKNADGTWYLDNTQIGTVAGGQVVGTIIARTPSGQSYVLENTGIFGKVYGWVHASKVKKA